jgi:hypothetical protein
VCKHHLHVWYDPKDDMYEVKCIFNWVIVYVIGVNIINEPHMR